jgi:LacI family transcriptional regulator
MAPRGRRKSVGVVEMAHDLGVSTATVSRALNGSAPVRRELADRIREHAEARGYVANRLARALSASTSREYAGFVIPYVDTPAYSAVAAECPVVELLRVSGIDAPSVFSDDEQALTDSILHLAGLGHADIAYLGTPRELSNGAARLRAIHLLLSALDAREAGLAPPAPAPPGARHAAHGGFYRSASWQAAVTRTRSYAPCGDR